MAANTLVALTADIVTAHLAHNPVTPTDLPSLITSVHAALAKTQAPAETQAPASNPAVPIRSSVKRDYLVCLEDGKKLVMLKRYLRAKYGMSPEEYRAKWGLPRDYPMVAPAYSEQRRGLAHAPVATPEMTVSALVADHSKTAIASTEEAAESANHPIETGNDLASMSPDTSTPEPLTPSDPAAGTQRPGNVSRLDEFRQPLASTNQQAAAFQPVTLANDVDQATALG